MIADDILRLMADLQRDREEKAAEIARLTALLGERDAKIAELYGLHRDREPNTEGMKRRASDHPQ